MTTSDDPSQQRTQAPHNAPTWRTAGAQPAQRPTPAPTRPTPKARFSQPLAGPGAIDPRLRTPSHPLANAGGAPTPSMPSAASPIARPATPRAQIVRTTPPTLPHTPTQPAPPPAPIRQAPSLDPVRILRELRAVSPTEFEHIVGGLVAFWGFGEVRQSGGPGDLAADLLCYDASGALTVVQCKRYAQQNNVGSPTVQTFIGMITVHHHARQGLLVTTADFTRAAMKLAQQHSFLVLINGTQLAEYVRKWRLATSAQSNHP